MSFTWLPTADSFHGKSGDLTVECRPLEGLLLQVGDLSVGTVLGIEVVDAVNLGPQLLTTEGARPEMVIRQDTLLAHFAPTTRRPVECQARWRVLPEGVLDLEVSTLTPGKWDGLAVQTHSRFKRTSMTAQEVVIDDSVVPGIILYRPAAAQFTYAEFCHPFDGIGLEVKQQDGMHSARYRLFGHDLEKGVILRGRLRGVLLPRAVDVAAAHAAYQRFLAEPPNLTL
ncbi:MAG: hypothetical protein U0796_10855 [Gemmatales bacterium]